MNIIEKMTIALNKYSDNAQVMRLSKEDYRQFYTELVKPDGVPNSGCDEHDPTIIWFNDIQVLEGDNAETEVLSKWDIVTMAHLKLEEVDDGCVHEPGGHWQPDDIMGVYAGAGFNRMFSKCVKCSVTIEQMTQRFMGVPIVYYLKVPDCLSERKGVL